MAADLLEIRDLSGIRLTGVNRWVHNEEGADAVLDEIFGVEVRRQARRGCFSAARSPRFSDLRFLCAPDCTGVDGSGCWNRVIPPRATERGRGSVLIPVTYFDHRKLHFSVV